MYTWLDKEVPSKDHQIRQIRARVEEPSKICTTVWLPMVEASRTESLWCTTEIRPTQSTWFGISRILENLEERSWYQKCTLLTQLSEYKSGQIQLWYLLYNWMYFQWVTFWTVFYKEYLIKKKFSKWFYEQTTNPIFNFRFCIKYIVNSFLYNYIFIF